MKHDLKALRELEKRLAEAKGGHDDDAIIERRAINAWVHDNLMPEPKVIIPLNYTASLDAAVALVERVLPGRISDLVHQAWGAVSKKHALHMRLWKPETDGSYAQEMALALCLACVRALIAQGEVAP